MKYTKEEQEESIATLKKMLKPGDSVYSIVRTVARSGMSRTIDFYIIAKDDYTKKPRLFYLSYHIARALGYSRSDDGALKVSGCGMDMCFHVVYSLGSKLWPKGTPKPHGTRNGEPDREGGYALKSVNI